MSVSKTALPSSTEGKKPVSKTALTSSTGDKNMYLHVGGGTVVKQNSIIGVFDLDTASTGKGTKIFLTKIQSAGNVVSASDDLPRCMVLTSQPLSIREKKMNSRLYLSPVSSATISKRGTEEL